MPSEVWIFLLIITFILYFPGSHSQIFSRPVSLSPHFSFCWPIFSPTSRFPCPLFCQLLPFLSLHCHLFPPLSIFTLPPTTLLCRVCQAKPPRAFGVAAAQRPEGTCVTGKTNTVHVGLTNLYHVPMHR